MLPQVESRVGLSRGDAGAINQPRSNNTTITALAGLTKDLADASFEIVKNRQEATALRQISDMQLRQEARMKELALNSSPGDSVLETGMDEFVKEANDFIASQPYYLRDGVRSKMLSLRDSTASSLLRLEAELSAEQLANDTEAFTNNILNSVRYGSMDEETAIKSINEYSEVLPLRIKDKVTKEMREGVKIMSLAKAVENNPNAVLNELKSGKYNDLDPNKLEQIQRQAQTLIEKRVREAEARQKDSIEYQSKITKARAKGDFFEAGLLQLQAEGIEDPEPSDILGAQYRAGVLPTQVQILSSEQAQIVADIVSQAENVDQFKAQVNTFLQGFPTQEERNIALRDLQRKSGKGHLFSMMIDDAITADISPLGRVLTNSMFDIKKEPAIANEAKTVVTKDDSMDDAVGEINAIMSELSRMEYVNRTDPTVGYEARKAIEDSLYVAARRLKDLGQAVNAKTIRDMYDGNRVYTTKNNIPISRANADSITEAGITKAISERLDIGEVYVLSPQNVDENGNLIPFTKKSNPELYNSIVSNIKTQALLAPDGKMPTNGEFTYTMLDQYGVEEFYELKNGKPVPIQLTESEIVRASSAIIQEKENRRKNLEKILSRPGRIFQ